MELNYHAKMLFKFKMISHNIWRHSHTPCTHNKWPCGSD